MFVSFAPLATAAAILSVSISEGDQTDRETMYQVVKEECSRYERPFTILDLGAGDGYFSFRLLEDFPQCTSVLVERNIGLNQKRAEILLEEIAKSQEKDRVILLNKSLTIKEIEALSHTEHFDLVLAFDFISKVHLPRTQTPRDLLDHLVHMGNKTFITIREKHRSYVDTLKDSKDLLTSICLPSGERTLYEFEGRGEKGLRTCWYNEEPTLHLTSSYTHTTYFFDFDAPPFQIAYFRPPGISLVTFLVLRGVWPTQEILAKTLKELHYPLDPCAVFLTGTSSIYLPMGCCQEHPSDTEKDMERLLLCNTQKEIKDHLKKDAN